MNTKKNTIKLITTYIIGFVILTLTAFGVIKFKNLNNVYATGVNGIVSSLTNSNFDDDKTSSYPDESFSGFTAYNGNQKQSNTNNDANIKAGIIDLNVDEWENKFPYAADKTWNNKNDKVLMIDSTVEKDGVTTKHDAFYGYRTNSAIKMDADSRYMVTVYVYTATNANIASLYLYDSEGEEFSSIRGINAYNNFTPYSFFIKTNNTQDLNLTLGLYLEGDGTVLFDNIRVEKLSESEYDLIKGSTSNASYKEIDKVDNVIANYFVNNNNELVNTDDNTNKTNFKADVFEEGKDTIAPKSVNDSDGNYTKALYLKNTDETYAQYTTVNNFLTFEQNTIYKVAVNVKTNNLKGTASLQLVRTDIEESEYEDHNYKADLNKTIKITANTVTETESVSNDYKTYSFLINSHPSETISYKLVAGLGIDKNSLTKGEMYISGIEISKIDYATFNSASTGSGTEKIDLVSNYAYTNSKIYLANGEFDAFKIADYNKPMPATPISWDVTTGKNTQKYGVVNTTVTNFNSSLNGLSNPVNPYKNIETNANVLMMYNETADTLIYKSASKNLTAKTYHKFEVLVQTQNAPLKLSLVTTKDDTEVELSSIVVDTEYAWENVNLFIYTGYQAMDVSLKLTLETNNYGYAYVDSAKFDYPDKTYTTVENEFKATTNSTNTVVTDLTNIYATSSKENYATPAYFTSEKVSGVEKAGIITLNSQHLDEVIYNSADLEKFNSLGNVNVLGIRATDDVYYTMKSKVGFKLTTGEEQFYKISVPVFTQNISSNNADAVKSKLGASIKLTGFEDSFTEIQSEGAWTTYTFYIKAESDITTYLELSIGNETTNAKGDVFFGNIEFKDDVTSAEYNSAVANSVVKLVSNASADKTPENENTETSKDKENSNNNMWLYLIPSLLTAAAIVIAVVGIAVRKIKWKKPTKKTKNVYDRNKTVSVQYYTRKATTMREEKIRELNADLEKISSQRKTYEDEYKQNLTKLREMKIKRANPAEIAKLEKDMKKNQKLSASLGVTANKIANELEYTKTDAYLNSLIKKLQREPSQTENKDNK